MRRSSQISTAIALALALVLGLGDERVGSSHSQDRTTPASTAGQTSQPLKGGTSTLLPDGTWLLLGGDGENGALDAAAIQDTSLNSTRLLSSSLHYPRAWHTATLLPDGTVFILGGIGADGQVVDVAESFNPATKQFAVLPSVDLTARAYHSATLLTDGRVLVAGGVSKYGELLSTAELWDPTTNTPSHLTSEPGAARRGHSATLLSDGRVLLWGGSGVGDKTPEGSELFDPESESFVPVDTLPSQSDSVTQSPALVGSLPQDRSEGVSVSTIIGLRFSVLLRVQNVSDHEVTLIGKEGLVPASVVPVDEGRLVFVTPTQRLQPRKDYTLSVRGLIDRSGRTCLMLRLHSQLSDPRSMPNRGLFNLTT